MNDEALELLREAAQELINDVRRRYPGEALKCPYMMALDAALIAQSKAAPQTRELPSNSPVDTHSVSRSAVAAPDSGREKPNYSAGLGGD